MSSRPPMWDRLEEVRQRFAALEAEMSEPSVASDPPRLQRLAREHAGLQPVVQLCADYERASSDLEQARAVLDEADEEEMRELAQLEAGELQDRIAEIEEEAKRALLPKDPNDERNVIVEIRAGTGGDEAGLWAADLFRAYQRYAEQRGWTTEVTSAHENAMGGFRLIVCQIAGSGAFSRFKYERGVHRVQRVPQTESQGRIHTSTATVAVLPEAVEDEVDIDWNVVRIDLFHSGGAGGQHVNKVQTGIRLTHEPSGIVVVCTDERSQLKNRVKAKTELLSRLQEKQRLAGESERRSDRRAQIGTGERNEKIRTYNFPENRITDHRIGLTRHDLDRMLEGELDPLIDAAATAEEARLLAEAAA